MLAQMLPEYARRNDVLVLALPRGGVPVAYEVAQALDAQLDVFLVRKLGVPGRPELAMGAIASDGVRVLNTDVVRALRIPASTIEAVAAAERQTLERRERAYRGDQPRPDMRDRIVVLVDDGLATGASMRAAISALQEQHPKRVVVAVPVAPAQTCRELSGEADEIVCAIAPDDFIGVSQWYRDFEQTTDDEVRDLLERARRRNAQKPPQDESRPLPQS
jgi:putative phosphoribosyl transferase